MFGMKIRELTSIVCFVSFFLFSCGPQEELSIKVVDENEKIDVQYEEGEITDDPEYVEDNIVSVDILTEAIGDLTKDGIDERVVIRNTSEVGDFGIIREILIYNWEDEHWVLWHTSTGAVLPSEHGGMMGDPFEGVSIERGCIVFKHFGGSRDKWNYTHRFRFQNNNWELIGATIVVGAPCDQWETLDYNLSNGDVVYTIEYGECENELPTKDVNKFNQSVQSPFLMDGYPIGENFIVVMDDDGRMYF